jgi:hypothetical protein
MSGHVVKLGSFIGQQQQCRHRKSLRSFLSELLRILVSSICKIAGCGFLNDAS